MKRLLGTKSTSKKINDLSGSEYWNKYLDQEFVPENCYAIRSIRVSSKKQERGKSLEEQHEITSEYCEKEGLSIKKTWEVAETASKHEMRTHFHAMLDYIKKSQATNKPIKHVVFSFQSRSNRNKESARALESLVDLGVTLHFARDRRKLTCKSDIAELMMWHMENLRNEAFIDELTKNAMAGTKKSIEAGRYPGGIPPYGYRSVGRKDKRHFVFDDDRANYMRAAFNIVASPVFFEEKLSDRKLKKKLDSMFPQLQDTPNRKRFCELLRNPFYNGEEFMYAKTIYKADPNIQPAIISKSKWLYVQDVLEGRHKGRKLSKAHPYIGMMNCKGRRLDKNGGLTDDVCGHAITAEQVRRKYKNGKTQQFNYYRCSSEVGQCSQRDKKYMKEVVGRNVSYRQEEIEVIFQDIFTSFSFDEVTSKRMKQYLWDEHFEAKKDNSARRNELEKRIKELDLYMDRAYEDKLRGTIVEEVWRKQDAKWHIEHQNILDEINSLKDSKDEYMSRGVELIELMQKAEIIYKNATPQKKRKMVELVSSNLLLADGSLEYHWRKPFNMLAINGDLENWRAREDLNPQPSDPKSDTLSN